FAHQTFDALTRDTKRFSYRRIRVELLFHRAGRNRTNSEPDRNANARLHIDADPLAVGYPERRCDSVRAFEFRGVAKRFTIAFGDAYRVASRCTRRERSGLVRKRRARFHT